MPGRTPLVGWLKGYMVPELLEIQVDDKLMEQRPEIYGGMKHFLKTTYEWRSKYYSDDQHQTNNVFYFIIGWRKWRMRNQPPWRWTRVFYLVLSDNESRSFRNINLHVTSFPNKFQIPDIEHYPSTVIEKNGKFSSSEFLIWQMLSANVRDS